MRKPTNLLLAGVLASVGCTAAAPAVTNTSPALSASSDAQHFGVYAYKLAGDVVTLFDKDGVEAGRISVSAPAVDTRVFDAEYTNGATDEADVGRPISNGTFVAPVTPETVLTAALADPALAPTWAAHQVRFTVNMQPRLAAGGFAPNDVASTSACSSYSCQGSGCTPLGCAKPANTDVGCSNPSQLAATQANNGLSNWLAAGPEYNGTTACRLATPGACAATYGGMSYNWNASNSKCVSVGAGYYEPVCQIAFSSNSWVASCPPVACTTPDYDAVPRNGSCNDPGSCTYSTGTVTCTTYH